MKRIIAFLCTVSMLISPFAYSVSATADTALTEVMSSMSTEVKVPEVGADFTDLPPYSTQSAPAAIPHTIETWVYSTDSNSSYWYSNILGNMQDGAKETNSFNFSLENNCPAVYFGALATDSAESSAYKFRFTASDSKIPPNTWTHVTFTVDTANSAVSLYINGVLTETKKMAEGMAEAWEAITFDESKTKYTVVGGRMNWSGKVTKPFAGQIASVAAYSDVRSAEEIARDYLNYTAPVTADLVFAYAFDGSKRAQYEDLSKNKNAISWAGYSFKAEEDVVIPEDYDYSMFVIGDIQTLTAKSSDTYLNNFYEWIGSNAASENAKAVIGVGDMTNDNNAEQWGRVVNAFSKLDSNIPHYPILGNHDSNDYGDDPNLYKNYVTLDHVECVASYDGSIKAYYNRFELNGKKFLFLGIGFYPVADVRRWASDVIKSNPDYNVIISTHAYLDENGELLQEDCAPEVREELVLPYSNVVLVLCGHMHTTDVQLYTELRDDGSKVQALITNQQDIGSNLPLGVVTQLYFTDSPETMKVNVANRVTCLPEGVEGYLGANSVDSFDLDLLENRMTPQAMDSNSDITWKFSNGVLTLGLAEGHTGDSETINTSSSEPWSAYKSAITKIVIDVAKPITVSGHTFKDFPNLVEVVLPKGQQLTFNGQYILSGCPKLAKVGYGDETEANTFDLTNIITSIPMNTFKDSSRGIAVDVLLPYSESLSFAGINCFNVFGFVTFHVAEGSDTAGALETWISKATNKANMKTVYYTDSELPTIADGYVNEGVNNFYWRINSAYTLIITNDGSVALENEVFTAPSTKPWASYKTKIKKLIFDVDHSISLEGPELFSGLTAMTTVVTPESKLYLHGDKIFKNCSSLVTFGPEGTAENTFDLRNIVGASISGSVTNGNPFNGCATGAAITVLMPYVKELSAETLPCIGYNSTTFQNASAPALLLIFNSTAKITFKVIPGTVGETVAQGYKGKTFSTWTAAGTTIDIVSYFDGVIESNGFSIRVNKTTSQSTHQNGLRTLYKFNRTFAVPNGFEIIEWGAILVSENVLGGRTVLLDENGNVVDADGSPITQAIKKPVWQNNGWAGSIIGQDETGVEFAVTLVNIGSGFYNSGVYSCGYVIFEDGDGNRYTEFSNYGEDTYGESDPEKAEAWKFVSLYETVVSMAENDLLSGSNGAEDDVIKATDASCTWDVLVAVSGQAPAKTENTVYTVIENKLYYYCRDGEKAEEKDKAEAVGEKTYTGVYALWVTDATT